MTRTSKLPKANTAASISRRVTRSPASAASRFTASSPERPCRKSNCRWVSARRPMARASTSGESGARPWSPRSSQRPISAKAGRRISSMVEVLARMAASWASRMTRSRLAAVSRLRCTAASLSSEGTARRSSTARRRPLRSWLRPATSRCCCSTSIGRSRWIRFRLSRAKRVSATAPTTTVAISSSVAGGMPQTGRSSAGLFIAIGSAKTGVGLCFCLCPCLYPWARP